jgi:hypothetical protein
MVRDRDELADERLHPAVRRAVDALAAADAATARNAEDAWAWVYGARDPRRAGRHQLQTFLWHDLPAKWSAGAVGHAEIAWALGALCDRLGMPLHARLCHAEETREVLEEWGRDAGAGVARFRRAMDRSGLQPPDVPALAWGALASREEAAARAHVADVLEEAIDAGRLRPGARGWRAEQQRITSLALDDPVPDYPGGQTWLQTIITARLGDWVDGRHASPLRGRLLRDLEPLLLHPVPPPPDADRVLAPLRWLLQRAAEEGLLLTERGNLSRALAREAAAALGWEHEAFGRQIRGEADLLTLPRWHDLLRSRGLVRRRGRRLLATTAGRALLADVATAWRGLCAALASQAGAQGALAEAVLLVLCDTVGDDPTYREVMEKVADLATEAGWRVDGIAALAEDDASRLVGPFVGTFECFGLLEDRWGPDAADGLRLTPAGRAAALEVLRLRGTTPREDR